MRETMEEKRRRENENWPVTIDENLLPTKSDVSATNQRINCINPLAREVVRGRGKRLRVVGGFHGRWQGVVIPFRISTDALRRKLPYKPSEIVREALIMQFNFNNERHRTVPLRETGCSLSDLLAEGEAVFGQPFFFSISPLMIRVFCCFCKYLPG